MTKTNINKLADSIDTDDDQIIDNQPKLNKPFLLTDDKYNLIRQFQADILKQLEIIPSFRKIINEVITIENLNVLKDKFINNQ